MSYWGDITLNFIQNISSNFWSEVINLGNKKLFRWSRSIHLYISLVFFVAYQQCPVNMNLLLRVSIQVIFVPILSSKKISLRSRRRSYFWNMFQSDLFRYIALDPAQQWFLDWFPVTFNVGRLLYPKKSNQNLISKEIAFWTRFWWFDFYIFLILEWSQPHLYLDANTTSHSFFECPMPLIDL